MILLRLAQLFGGDFDDVGAAYAQVEPLVANGAMHTDLDGVDERTSLPAVLVGGELEHVVGEARGLKRTGAEQTVVAARRRGWEGR